MDADAKRPGEGGWPNVDTCRQGGKGSKIGKILQTSFMDNGWPLRNLNHYFFANATLHKLNNNYESNTNSVI